MRRWSTLALVAAMAVLMGALGVRVRFDAPAVQAADTWNVVAGGDDTVNGFSLNAYLPGTLAIHAGDTVNWDFQGFHTVTFNSGKEPLALNIPGPEPGQRVAGSAFFPFGLTGDTAIYSGSEQISSGTPPPGASPEDAPAFGVTFTTPGVYTYVCMIHGGMHGTIQVLAAGSSLPETPAQAKARGQAEGDALTALITDAVKGVKSAGAAASSGAAVQTVAAGISNAAGVSALRFLPGDLTLHRGDLVTWINADPFEPHTISFLSGTQAPDNIVVKTQPGGPPLLVFTPEVSLPSGGTTYSGQGFVNSGRLTVGNGFTLRFDAPAGTYEYQCLIHTEMKGHITVTE